MELDYVFLGLRIRQFRIAAGLTQSALAEIVGIEPSNISHIERAVSKVGLSTLVKIANALNCTVNDLLCDSLPRERLAFDNEIARLIQDCSPKEIRLISDLIRATKESLRRRNYDQ